MASSAQLEELSLAEYWAFRERCGTAFADAVYGQLRLAPLSVQLLDTEPLQRLRQLKQLGCAPFVFPSAEHTRFQHSLGVAHLAASCAWHLQQRQPELGLTGLELQLAELAGLAHDLGHGPFSHVFESELLPALGIRGWRHERMSEQLLELSVDLAGADLDRQHVAMVQQLIRGQARGHDWQARPWMLQVVASGLDVDKADYLARDALAAGVPHARSFSHLLTHHTRVYGGDICFAAEQQPELCALYSARTTMHREVYQHRRAKAAEFMVVDALAAAEHVLRIRERVEDPQEFLQLDDSLLRDIERRSRSDPSLARSAHVLRRLRRRDLYPCVAELWLPQELHGHHTDAPVTADEVAACQSHNSVLLQAGDLRLHNMKLDFCNGDKDPLCSLKLFDACGVSGVSAADDAFRPAAFLQRTVRLYLAADCVGSERAARVAAAQAAFGAAMQRRYGSAVVRLIKHPSSQPSPEQQQAAWWHERAQRKAAEAQLQVAVTWDAAQAAAAAGYASGSGSATCFAADDGDGLVVPETEDEGDDELGLTQLGAQQQAQLHAQEHAQEQVPMLQD